MRSIRFCTVVSCQREYTVEDAPAELQQIVYYEGVCPDCALTGAAQLPTDRVKLSAVGHETFAKLDARFAPHQFTGRK